MKEDKEHKIDKVFKQKFEDFEVPINTELFEEIYNRSDIESQSRRVISFTPKKSDNYYFYLTAAVVSGIILCVGLFFFKSSNQTERASTVAVLKPQSSGKVEKLNKENNNEVKVPAKKSEDVSIDKVTQNKTSDKSLRAINKENFLIVTTLDFTKEISLPDSSIITLNRNSTIKYSKNFNSSRLVKLEGDAFFKVKKMKDLNFKIKCNNSIVEVLGTSFNILSRKDSLHDEVRVFTGRVKVVSIHHPDSEIILTSGMNAKVDKNGNIGNLPNSIAEPASKSNQLSFDRDSIRSILPIIENYYSIKIEVENPEILNCTFTGKFNKTSAEEFLSILTASLNLSYQLKDQTYFLQGSGCK